MSAIAAATSLAAAVSAALAAVTFAAAAVAAVAAPVAVGLHNSEGEVLGSMWVGYPKAIFCCNFRFGLGCLLQLLFLKEKTPGLTPGGKIRKEG